MYIKGDTFPESFWLSLRDVEDKHFKLKSDLLTLPRMANQLKFQENNFDFISLQTFPASTPEYVDSTFHTTCDMWCFYLYLFKMLIWMQEKKKWDASFDVLSKNDVLKDIRWECFS